MRIGQTSLVVFLSRLLASVLGFVATIYFARVLGAEVYGIYALIIAFVAWLKMFGSLGISGAMIKRISEGEDQGAYLMAGLVWLTGMGIVLSIAVVLAHGYVESYLAGWAEHVTISVIWFVIALLFVRLAATAVSGTLQGQKLVHIAGLLDPIKIGLRSLLQISLVFLGFHLLGMMVGYIIGYGLGLLVGVLFITIRPQLPTRAHLRSVFDYAKYAWLGKMQGRTYKDVDLLILGALVPTGLVGVYAIVWSFVQLLKLFGSAVSSAVFPEISAVSAQESQAEATAIIEDALTYGGFIVLPGAIGGTLLADRLLRIYGPEFVQGTELFWIVLLSGVFYAYMRQCLNALNGLDRPDLSFRVNLLFIVSNVALNVILILEYGWIGAAIASATTTALGFILAYSQLTRIVTVQFPIRAVMQQLSAAIFMGSVIVSIDALVRVTGIIQHNVAILFVLVGFGAALYVLTLLVISPDFRAVVDRNLPIDLPYISRET